MYHGDVQGKHLLSCEQCFNFFGGNGRPASKVPLTSTLQLLSTKSFATWSGLPNLPSQSQDLKGRMYYNEHLWIGRFSCSQIRMQNFLFFFEIREAHIGNWLNKSRWTCLNSLKRKMVFKAFIRADRRSWGLYFVRAAWCSKINKTLSPASMK